MVNVDRPRNSLCEAATAAAWPLRAPPGTTATMLRIIGGQYKSRRLASPEDTAVTRPYTGLVREAVFNMLRGWFPDARVLDLFAGVGTMGLEAISRGAQHATFVEQNRKMARLLEENIRELECGDRATIVLGDALSLTALHRAPRPVDIVFIDPPYRMLKDETQRRRVFKQIERCRDLMGEKGFLVLRSPIPPDRMDAEVERFEGPEVHQYGKATWVMLYAPRPEKSGEVTAAESPSHASADDPR